MIWNSYKEAVPMTIAEVDPTKYLPSTMQLLNRFNGRIILELSKPQAACHAEGSVSREEFEELKSQMGQVIYELRLVQEAN
jgi:hypothetical protein